MNQTVQIQPGFYQKIQRRCTECDGEGEFISNRCRKCNGKKIVVLKELVRVRIEPGMKSNKRLVFSGKGNHVNRTVEAGDLIIELELKEHSTFIRKDMDLIIKMEITLAESLCGFKRIIQTLDQRKLLISNPPGTVIGNEAYRSVANEGMPMRGSDGRVKGQLIIIFIVTFPQNEYTGENLKVIGDILPPRPDYGYCDDGQVLKSELYDPKSSSRRRRQQASQGETVECASQ
ncbi:dnaJ homolog subfamily A member 4-like [Octopus sinensis]|uniref:DnaJ homolog subfamily A member 4-like n=1 Tax=Octopus sinensis TaxID=2607531 RepID=A0A7E6EJW0_9MOLL|nr:dnaJ homolog subfamily A member 4-like [Octopus sinensis]